MKIKTRYTIYSMRLKFNKTAGGFKRKKASVESILSPANTPITKCKVSPKQMINYLNDIPVTVLQD